MMTEWASFSSKVDSSTSTTKLPLHVLKRMFLFVLHKEILNSDGQSHSVGAVREPSAYEMNGRGVFGFGLSSEPILMPYVFRGFVARLCESLRGNNDCLPYGWVFSSECLDEVRGTIDLEVQTREGRLDRAGRMIGPIVCNVNRVTLDTLENRLLKCAYIEGKRMLQEIEIGGFKPGDEEMRYVQEALCADEGNTIISSVPLEEMRRVLDDWEVSSCRHGEWVEPLYLALVLIHARPERLLADAQCQRTLLENVSVLSHIVFEKYVVLKLQDELKKHDIALKSQKTLNLYGRLGSSSSGVKAFEMIKVRGSLKPDLLFEKNHQCFMVGDVKYKLAPHENGFHIPKRSDLHQIFTYSSAHKVPALIIYAGCEKTCTSANENTEVFTELRYGEEGSDAASCFVFVINAAKHVEDLEPVVDFISSHAVVI